MTFDLMYMGSTGSAFDRSNRRPIMHFGWIGGLVNPLMRVSGGGAAQAPSKATAASS